MEREERGSLKEGERGRMGKEMEKCQKGTKEKKGSGVTMVRRRGKEY